VTRYRTSFCLMCVQATFFACFMIGIAAAFRINYWLYLVLTYGWLDVRKLNLHFTSYRPMTISNGDKASELANFAVFAASLVLCLVIGGTLMSAIERVTRRLGKAIDIFKTMDALAKEDHGSIVFGIMGMAIAIATAFVTIYASPLHVLRNCAIFVVITSIVLRIALRKVATTPVPPRHMEEEQES
jgi:hypothetical protein